MFRYDHEQRAPPEGERNALPQTASGEIPLPLGLLSTLGGRLGEGNVQVKANG